MRNGIVKSIDQVTTKEGDKAWRLVTDAQNIGADGKNRCAIYIGRDGAKPMIGDMVSWSAHQAWWGAVKVRKLSFEVDPNDPALYTG